MSEETTQQANERRAEERAQMERDAGKMKLFLSQVKAQLRAKEND